MVQTSPLARAVLRSTAPALIICLLFQLFLGYRRDYLGHFAAGYGGTLCAIGVLLALIPVKMFSRFSSLGIVVCTIVCIAGGAVTEATVFRLAKFDEIDFCNQSLGAVLAGLATIHMADHLKPADNLLSSTLAIGLIYLIAGTYFALT